MKKMKIAVSTILAIVLSLSLLSVVAFADGYNRVSALDDVMPNYYPLSTSFGYFEIPYGTVVGYGNQNRAYDVRGTQAALTDIHNDFGINCDPYGVDGLFGGNTYNAIYNFQVATGLTPDGYAGHYTFMELAQHTFEI